MIHHQHAESEQVNDEIRNHISELGDDWDHSEEMSSYYVWAERMIEEFQLEIPTPLIGQQKLRKNRLGQFKPFRNEHGLNYQILFNVIYKDGRREWMKLTTLLHELLHLWQQINGTAPKGNYHNKEFKAKAGEYGLIVDSKGFTVVEEGLLTELLKEHGVEVDLNDINNTPDAGPTRSTKVVWTCDCESHKIRVPEDYDVELKCLKCDSVFQETG